MQNKKKFINWLNPQNETNLIDVASGTGDIAKLYLKKINQAYIKSLKSKTDWNILFVDVSNIDFVENQSDYLRILFKIKEIK